MVGQLARKVCSTFFAFKQNAGRGNAGGGSEIVAQLFHVYGTADVGQAWGRNRG